MLSAFKAQAIHELKPRDKSKIESLLGYGDRLLVGLNTGVLRIYRVDDISGSSKADENGKLPETPTKGGVVKLLQEEEKFSKNRVLQLAIIKEANLLVSLSDGYVSLHDLQNFALVERIEQSKGAACFGVTSNVVEDPETEVKGLVSRLAIGVKKKLLCWTWQDMEQLPEVIEMSLEANIKTLNWVTGTKLIVGMDPGFSVIDVEAQDITIINKPAHRATADAGANEPSGSRFGAVSSSGMGYMGMSSWVPKPMVTGLTDDQVLLAKDVNTLFIESSGKALEKRQVPWSFAPEAVGYSYPYLLALQQPDKGTLQIRNPDTLSLLQTISVPGANILHVPQPNISLAHAGKGFLVASDRVIWRMNALPYHTQISELLGRQRFDEAVSLLNLLEDTLIDDKTGRIREIMIEKGIALFGQLKYEQARDIFIDAEAPPQRIISLYPKSISGPLASSSDQSDDSDEADDEASKAETNKAAPSTPSKTGFGLFKGGHKKQDADVASIRAPARMDPDNMSIRSKLTVRTDEKHLEGANFKTAVMGLCSFLAQVRAQIQRYLTTDGVLKENPPKFDNETGRPPFANFFPATTFERPREDVDWQQELLEVAKLVDTTLFKSYMLVQPGFVGSLFRLDNFCDPEVVQAMLYENERYNDLIDFLHGKRLHKQVLEMLSRFGKGDASGEIPEGMRGPQRTVAYLQQLPPELVDVILEYGEWPLREDSTTGMNIFLADTGKAEKLPRWKVAKFLEKIDKKLEIRYIEHIIREWKETDPDFHQQLIDMYLVVLKQEDLEDDYRQKLKGKLEAILQESKVYDRAKTIKQLPSNDANFSEARAIVLSAMGNHKEALIIYVFKVNDYEKAEKYCNKYYAEKQAGTHQDGKPLQEKQLRQIELDDTPDKPNLFAILLGLYLAPPRNEEKRWPQALDLLAKHGPRLPADATLKLMPDDLAVKELQDYFRGRIRNATSILREEQIVRNLQQARHADTERLLRIGPDNNLSGKPMGRNRRFRINEDDHCKKCHKRFGASAVRVYPDNQVVHYGCVESSGKPRPGSSGFGHLRQASNWG